MFVWDTGDLYEEDCAEEMVLASRHTWCSITRSVHEGLILSNLFICDRYCWAYVSHFCANDFMWYAHWDMAHGMVQSFTWERRTLNVNRWTSNSLLRDRHMGLQTGCGSQGLNRPVRFAISARTSMIPLYSSCTHCVEHMSKWCQRTVAAHHWWA